MDLAASDARSLARSIRFYFLATIYLCACNVHFNITCHNVCVAVCARVSVCKEYFLNHSYLLKYGCIACTIYSQFAFGIFYLRTLCCILLHICTQLQRPFRRQQFIYVSFHIYIIILLRFFFVFWLNALQTLFSHIAGIPSHTYHL